MSKGKKASGAKGKTGPQPFTAETAPRKGRKPGSRNKTPPKAILESIVAHACEAHGKARIPRLQAALNALFVENSAFYVKAIAEASVRLHQIEAGGQLDDGRPVLLTVRWGAPSAAQIEHQKYALELQAQKPPLGPLPSPAPAPADAAKEESPPPQAPIDKDRERLNRPWLSVV